MNVTQTAKQAKEASFTLAALSGETKNRALRTMAAALRAHADEIVQAKVKRNNEKYPVEKAKDSAKKYDEL